MRGSTTCWRPARPPAVIAQDSFGTPNVWTVNLDSTDPGGADATVKAVAFCSPTG